MKHFYLLLVAIFFSMQIHSQNAPFITTWEVTTGSLGITIPTSGTGYNYSIDFGDGTVQNNLTGDVSHTYSAPGVYTVTISGDFPRIRFANYIMNNNPMLLKIKSVEQWGDIEWASMESAFTGCSSLIINATDAPDLSQVTTMAGMFGGATSLNQTINHWDVSNVTNLNNLFSGAILFNQPLSNWDVSNVTNMSNMFLRASGFNQSLITWDVSSVTNMIGMFREASAFNQDIDNWDVSNVVQMVDMFNKVTSFNQPLNNWNVSNVTNMNGMFQSAINFNQPLSNWNVSNVTSMSAMFYGATSFNQPLDSWNVVNVSNKSYMFSNAISFNQSLNSWGGVPIIGNIDHMFNGARSFNQDLSLWNFSNTQIFSNFIQKSGLDIINYELLLDRFVNLGITNKIFYPNNLFYCNETSRNDLINNKGWTISGDYLYFNCTSAYPSNAFVTEWNVQSPNLTIIIPTTGTGYNYNIDFGDGTLQTNVTGTATHTYSQPGVYNVAITGDFPRIYFFSISSGIRFYITGILQWGTSQWKSMESAFRGCENLNVLAFDSPDLSQVTNMSSMFEYSGTIINSIDSWDVSNITNMNRLFVNTDVLSSLESWDVSNVSNMAGMFIGGYFLQLNLNNWDVSNVVNMAEMFSGSYFWEDLDNWDVSSVTDMSKMFFDCKNFNNPLNSWDVSNVTNMSYMFSGDFNSSSASGNSFKLPLNNWDVSNVTNMRGMFYHNPLFNQPLDNWNVSNVLYMDSMFRRATSFNRNLQNWDVSNVIDMSYMFAGNIGIYSLYNKPLNNWDVSSVTKLTGMFSNTRFYNQPLDNWDVSNVTNMSFMFNNTRAFNQPLNSWDVSNVTNMSAMFEKAIEFNQPLNNWDVSNVMAMKSMFNKASDFNQNLSNWDFNLDIDFHFVDYNFLNECGLDIPNYDALLSRFAQLGLQNKKLGAKDLYYCNSGARDYLINILGWFIHGDNLSNECKTIIGDILYDQNNNGCDPNDIEVDGFMVNANNGSTNYSSFSYEGLYNLGVIGTSFTVSVVNAPPYYTISPASATVTFSGTTTEVLDFCVTANQSIEDLNITLLPPSEARPGFEADYRLVVKNVGTETIANVVATLEFDDTMQQFVAANPTPGTTTTNTLTFTIGTMQPFQSFKADITMQTFPPQTVNGGDILNFTAEVTPSSIDHTPNDNIYNLAQIVVNSYDPNDKQVLQGEELHIDDVNEYLDYLIRFQNSGTASAIHVRILDTLHPKLDWSTLKPISASHEYYVQITDGNKVEFKFDNIHLPHEDDDEPGSHGFIAYKIKLKNNVQVGDIISGDAAIYFDFNDPIITNMVHTQIVDPPLGLADNQDPLNQITVYPNPTNKTLHIFLTDNIQLEEVSIYDLQGKEVQKFQGKEKSLNVENLRSGMYFLKITTGHGVVNRKLVKE